MTIYLGFGVVVKAVMDLLNDCLCLIIFVYFRESATPI